MGRGLEKPPPPHPPKHGREVVDRQSGWRPRVAGLCLLLAASWDAPLQLSLLPVIQRVLAAHLAVCLRCFEPAPRNQPSAFRHLGLAPGRAVCSHHECSALGFCTSLLTTWIWLFNRLRSQPGKIGRLIRAPAAETTSSLAVYFFGSQGLCPTLQPLLPLCGF